MRGYADAADWVYRQAISPGSWTAGEVLTLTEIRQVHRVLMTPVWDVPTGITLVYFVGPSLEEVRRWGCPSPFQAVLRELRRDAGLSILAAGEATGRSFQATNEAMTRLEAAGVVRQVNVGRCNRTFETPAIIDAFTALERQHASPTGDTRSAPPDRLAPARRR